MFIDGHISIENNITWVIDPQRDENRYNLAYLIREEFPAANDGPIRVRLTIERLPDFQAKGLKNDVQKSQNRKA